MASQDTLRLAFLGCGFASRLHSDTLRRLGGVERYYASRDPARARDYARRFGGAGAFGSYEEALGAQEVDAVLVATPPDSHLELALSALGAGKHVIVEKPPFLKSADFAAVRAARSAHGALACVAENYFYKPLARHLRELLRSGVIGEPRFLYVNALKSQSAGGWRADPARAGGGAFFEGGIHWVSLVASLGLTLGRVGGLRPRPREGPDRSMLVTLEYDEGAVGALYHSWETPSLLRGLRMSRIWGSEGSISFESNGLFVITRGRRTRMAFPGFRDVAGYRGMFEDFLSSIRTGREPHYTLDLAERDLRLVEQVYASLERPGMATSVGEATRKGQTTS